MPVPPGREKEGRKGMSPTTGSEADMAAVFSVGIRETMEN